MVLRVGLVATCLNTEHIRGMGKYVFEMIKQSVPQDAIDWWMFGNDSRYDLIAPVGSPVHKDIFTFKGDRFHLWEQLGLPLRCIKRKVDVVHCTEGTLSLWQPKPTVVTVHDTLSWEDRHDTRMAEVYFDRLLPAALKKCAAIVTISESSKTDILNRWPWLESKLTVIPHGIEEAYFTNDQPSLPTDLLTEIGEGPYLIYLGGPMERKRFKWALEVLTKTAQASLKLVACGFGAEARKTANNQLPPHLQRRVVFANFLSDSELRALYRGASAVLYPTLYEGFGFPAIEAQASGVPAIFSALGSLKELIGPLAMVVPPHDLNAWVNAVRLAMNLREQRAVLADKAATWARQFEWHASYQKHLIIYQRTSTVGNK